MRAAIALLALLVGACSAAPKAPAKQDWHLLTGLPLFMGAGDVQSVLNGQAGQAPLLTHLSQGRKMIPIDTLTATHLRTVHYLLAVQPRVMPPEDLVAFDAWVRGGGQAVILADPDLVWPTDYAMGDPRTPPASTLLDPLFAHWGFKLLGMRGQPRAVSAMLGDYPATLMNPGHWVSQSKECNVEDGGVTIVCTLGKGRVILLADADIGDARLLVGNVAKNLAAIDSLLTRLEKPER
ncbi:MAG: hypothetical protein RIS52_288 [Pseudomonadota bacterium]